MFVILVTYKASLEVIDKHLVAHREFLESGYQSNLLIASGPQNPRSGGLIIACTKSREQLEAFLEQDPFKVHDLAEYQLIEFDPVKYHAQFKCFIDATA